MSQYLEVKHEEAVASVRNKYAMVDRIKVKRAFGFTCPIKTIAIFAHNYEMSLLPDEMPENVKLVVEACRTKQDV
jgi:hypothetical protein